MPTPAAAESNIESKACECMNKEREQEKEHRKLTFSFHLTKLGTKKCRKGMRKGQTKQEHHNPLSVLVVVTLKVG